MYSEGAAIDDEGDEFAEPAGIIVFYCFCVAKGFKDGVAAEYFRLGSVEG